MADREVKLVFKVEDNGTISVLDQAGKRLDEIGSRAERMGTATASGFSRLQAGIVAVNQAFQLATGIFREASHAVEQFMAPLMRAGELAEFSQSIGVAVRDITALRVAAETSELTMQEMGIGFRFLSRNIVEAQDASSKAGRIFEALGITVRDTTTGAIRNANDVMLDLADAVAALPDGVQKTNLSLELLGRGGSRWLPVLNLGAAGLRQMRDEAVALGVAFDDQLAESADQLGDDMRRLQLGVEGLQIAVAAELLPAMNDAVTTATQWMIANRGLVATDVAGWIREQVGDIWTLVQAVAALKAQLDAMVAPITSTGTRFGALVGFGSRRGAGGSWASDTDVTSVPGVGTVLSPSQDRPFWDRYDTIIPGFTGPLQPPRQIDLARLTAAMAPQPSGGRGGGGGGSAAQAERDAYEDIKQVTADLRDAERERLDLQQAIRDQVEARAEIEADNARAQLDALQRQKAGADVIAAAEQIVLDRERAVLQTRLEGLNAQLETVRALEGTSATTVKLQTEMEQVRAELARMPVIVEQTATALNTIQDDLRGTFADVVRGIAQGTSNLDDFLERAVQGLGAKLLERGATELFDLAFSGGTTRGPMLAALFGSSAISPSGTSGIRTAQDYAVNWGVQPGQVPVPQDTGYFGLKEAVVTGYQGLGVGAAIGGLGAGIAGATGADLATQRGIQYGGAAGGLTGGVVAGLAFGAAAGPLGMIIGAAIGAVLGAVLPDLINKPPTQEKIATDAARMLLQGGGFPMPLRNIGMEGRGPDWIFRDQETWRDNKLFQAVFGAYYTGPQYGTTRLDDPAWQGRTPGWWRQQALEAAKASPIEAAFRGSDFKDKAPYFIARTLGMSDKDAMSFVNMVANTALASQMPIDVMQRRLRGVAEESGMTIFSSLRSLEDQVIAGTITGGEYGQALRGMGDLWAGDQRYQAAGIDLNAMLNDPRYRYAVRREVTGARDIYGAWQTHEVLDADLFAKAIDRAIRAKDTAKSLRDEARDMRIAGLTPRRQLAEQQTRLLNVDAALARLRGEGGITEAESYEYEELLGERAAIGRAIYSLSSSLGGARGRAAQRLGTSIVSETAGIYEAWAENPITPTQQNTKATLDNNTAVNNNTAQIINLSQKIDNLAGVIVAYSATSATSTETVVNNIVTDPWASRRLRNALAW